MTETTAQAEAQVEAAQTANAQAESALAESVQAVSPQAANQQPIKARLPKRLLAMLLLLTLASVSGLMAKQGVLFCMLTLLMVIAVLGRQKAGLYMLRGYTIIQLALVSLLPVILYDPDNLVAGPSTFHLGDWQGKLPDWLVFTVLILLALVQVWIAFTPKVKAYCHIKNSMNIMK
ncbi:hypothetical protein [Shewanella sp. Isolate7]|uniref:hypothetical protein n=1 Tax=Shewanella sp. Isolate7 TaxID=2908528 RepID=UPI001EFE7723|nr:hypothetical protein [Shewanella sp. Isolate7]MCG9723406.1 hypothetical protein [Shewanella sp. Isolate7]